MRKHLVLSCLAAAVLLLVSLSYASEKLSRPSEKKQVDLLDEFDKGNLRDIARGRGSMEKVGNKNYVVHPTFGSAADFGLAWTLPEGTSKFRVTMKFKWSDKSQYNNGSGIQVGFNNVARIIEGYGVALTTKWFKKHPQGSALAGRLNPRAKMDYSAGALPRGIHNGMHKLVIDVDANKGIRVRIDDNDIAIWHGQFEPNSVCISGDEFVDWRIHTLLVEFGGDAGEIPDEAIGLRFRPKENENTGEKSDNKEDKNKDGDTHERAPKPDQRKHCPTCTCFDEL